jgi:hypothetical protein
MSWAQGALTHVNVLCRTLEGVTMKFDADKANRASAGTRVLHLPVSEIRAKAVVVRIYDAPLSDEAIARCRAKAKARAKFRRCLP